MSLLSDLDELKKRLKRAAGDITPDPIEDATTYLARFGGDVVRGTIARGINVDPLAQATGGRFGLNVPLDPRDLLSGGAGRGLYYNQIDPAKEAVTRTLAGENPLAGTSGSPTDRLRQLGQSWRDRDDTLAKRIADATVDPLNVVGFGATGGAKSLGLAALREFAAPAAGQLAGGLLDERLGGPFTRYNLLENAGLLAGGFGPNLAKNVPRPAPTLATATQAFGAAAGAVGGYQASEGQDPWERALFTLGGGVAGGALGRQVARGGPIGFSIQNVGTPGGVGTVSQKLSRLQQATKPPDPLDAIPTALAGSLPERTRAGFSALNTILNDILNPARNRPEAHAAIGGAGGYLGRLQEADYIGKLQADGLKPAADALDTAYTNQAITPKPAYLQRIAAAKAQAVRNAQDLTQRALEAQRAGQSREARRLKTRALAAREAPARIDQYAFSGPAIIEHADEFDMAPATEAAYRQIRSAYDALATREQAAGVLETFRDNYINRVWNLDPDEAAGFRIARRPDARQNFQQEAVFSDFLEGLAAGYEPRTMNTRALYEARVTASNAALLQKEFIDTQLKPRIVKSSDAAYKADPKGYVHMDAGFLKRVFPTLSTERVNGVLGRLLQEVQAGEDETAALRRARGGIREAQGVGFQNLYLPKEWADELAAQLGPATYEDKDFLKPIGWLNDRLRTLKLGMDLAQVFRIGPAALTQAIAADPLHPWRGVSVAGDVLADIMKGREKFDLDPVTQSWVRYLPGFGRPGAMGEAFDMPARAPRGPVKVPGLGHVGRGVTVTYDALEDLQFQKFIPSLQVRTAEMVYQSLARPGMTPDEVDALKRAVGTRVGTLIAGLGRTAAGVSRDRAFAERLLILSPTWMRGLLKDVTDVAKSGVEGQLARRFWGTTAVVGVGTAVGLTMLFKSAAGGYGDPLNPDWDEMGRDLKELLFDPKSERNVWNPDSANFLSVELPGGQGRFDFWGPYRPLLRAVAAPVTGAIKGGDAAREAMAKANGEFSDEVVRAVAGAFFGGIGSETKRYGGQWASGRMALIPRQMLDAIKNEDFFGRPIRTSRDQGTRYLQQAVYSSAALLPGIAEPVAPAILSLVGIDADVANVVGEHSRAVPEGLGSLKSSVIRAPLSALGINARFTSQDPGDIKQAIRDLATSKGLHAGQDPVAWYRSTSDLNQAEKAAFLSANPRVRTYIEQKRLDAGAREDKPIGREAQRLFSADRTTFSQKLRAQKEELGRLYAAGQLSGDDYRGRRTDAETEYSISLQTAAQMRFGTSDLDSIYQQMGSADPFDKMLDGYYAIRPTGQDRASMDAFFAARAAFLDAQPKEMVEQFYQRQQDMAVDAVERAYLQDSRLMSERMRIPQYGGLSLQDGRAVQTALARVSDLQRVYPNLDRQTALLYDRNTDPKTKLRVLLYWSRVLQKNPALTLYEAQHSTLPRFYGSLTVDAFQDAIAS